MSRLPTALALGVFALALTACGSSDEKTYTPVNNAVPSASPAPTAAPTTAPTPTSTPTSPTPTGSTTPTPTATTTPTTTPTATGVPVTPLPPTPTPGLAGRVDSGVPAGASIVVTTGETCLACAVENQDAILDTDWDNFATASLQVGLLAAGLGLGELTITVNLSEAVDPSLAFTTPLGYSELPNFPGFVVSFPDSALLTLSLFPSIEIAALMDDTVVATESYGYGLLNMIGIDTILNDINNGRVYLTMGEENAVAEPYNAIRISFTASVADVLLALDVHQVAIAGITGTVSGDVPAPPFP